MVLLRLSRERRKLINNVITVREMADEFKIVHDSFLSLFVEVDDRKQMTE